METKFVPQYPNSKDIHSFENGLAFQDFVATKMHDNLGITITNYSSMMWQFGNGENRQGIEIKLDRLCNKTNRLSIEIAEKSRAINSDFVPSGILRQDNSWLYIQGNWEILFVFAKTTLALLYNSKRYQEHEEHGTVRAFYLPVDHAKKYAAKVLEFDNKGLIK